MEEPCGRRFHVGAGQGAVACSPSSARLSSFQTLSLVQVSLKENIWLHRALRDGLRKRWVNCYGCLELDVGGRELGCQNT